MTDNEILVIFGADLSVSVRGSGGPYADAEIRMHIYHSRIPNRIRQTSPAIHFHSDVSRSVCVVSMTPNLFPMTSPSWCRYLSHTSQKMPRSHKFSIDKFIKVKMWCKLDVHANHWRWWYTDSYVEKLQFYLQIPTFTNIWGDARCRLAWGDELAFGSER